MWPGVWISLTVWPIFKTHSHLIIAIAYWFLFPWVTGYFGFLLTQLGKQAGEHGSYAFYRSFQYMSRGRWRHVQLGKFFFVQVSKGGPICIGELQLVWTGRYSNHPLASIRLYYLPEQLPDGRQSHHGQVSH